MHYRIRTVLQRKSFAATLKFRVICNGGRTSSREDDTWVCLKYGS